MHASPTSFAHLPRVAFARAALCLLSLALVVFAAVQPAHAEDDFLPPEQAFRFSARPHDAKSVEVTFAIAPGYYLYREQFKFAATGALRIESHVFCTAIREYAE